MLKGQRRNEIGEAKWSEVDLEKRLLVIPSARNKNRKSHHEVPLSEAAIEVIEDVRRVCKALNIERGIVRLTGPEHKKP